MAFQPRNGLFVTPEDFIQFNNYFADLYRDSKDFQPNKYDLLDNYSILVKNITFVVTEKCNLACTYCYETHKTSTRMSKEIAKAAVDMIFDQEKINGYYNFKITPGVVLDFIGGEPLLEIDLIDYIVEYFKFKAFELDHPWQYNYMISVSSNGTLYLSKKVQRFLQRNKGRVSMTISIDGDQELHDACRVYRNGRGSFDIVERSVRQWVNDNNGVVQTKATTAPGNIAHMVRAFKYMFEDLKIRGGFSNVVYEKGWKVSDARLLYKNLVELADWMLEDERYAQYYLSYFDDVIGRPLDDDRNFCGGNGEMLAIGTKGQCSSCLRFLKYTLERREEQVCGDVFKGMDSVDENDWLNDLKQITMTSQSPSKCQDCPVAQGCGGCTAYNYDYSGNANIKATFACKMHRARVLANVYYWNTLYRKLNIKLRFPMNMPLNWGLEIIDEDEFWALTNLAKEDYD